MVLSLSTILMLSFSSSVFAGGVKDLMMDAEDAIVAKFSQEAQQVESITNHSFTPVKNGIGLKAEVETINPTTMLGHSWICIVSFIKVGTSYTPTDVACK